MKHKILLLLLTLFVIKTITTKVYSQKVIDIFVYHGSAGETSLWDANKKDFLSEIPIVKRKGQTINIKIVNPNPLFYSYELKQDDVEIKDDYPDISQLAAVANTLFGGMLSGEADDDPLAKYRGMVEKLEEELEKAKRVMRDSDIPEELADAKNNWVTGGLKLAMKKLKDPAEFPNGSGHFNSPTLAKDLADAITVVDDDFQKRAYSALNTAYLQRVEEIKNLMDPKNIQKEILQSFSVRDNPSKIILVIKAKDSKQSTVRDTKEIVLAHIQSFFDRPIIELVPVANVRFANNVTEFYLANKFIQQHLKNDVSVVPGVILNVNVARFGDIKEMAVGFGLGYNVVPKENRLEQLYLSSLFSYKNFLKVGLGYGFSSYPSALKDGGRVGDPLPDDIKNLKDLLDYERKAGFFLSFSFTGLKLK